jgi:mannose-6-phosphate isomerase
MGQDCIRSKEGSMISSSESDTQRVPNAPLIFQPVFRSYLWGGKRLATHLNKPVPGEGQWAESWEIVDHGDDQSVVASGPWKGWTLRALIESFPEEVLGASGAANFQSFPLLLKYLDCNSVLSVQVHPDDEYGQKMTPPDLGKTEAWYIVDAQEGAVLYAGLRSEVTQAALEDAIKAGKTEECLHAIHPRAGDCVFIPAGTVHALGGGLIVAEIQQASDTTFRLFDWNRVDASGKSRPLHIDQALDVIDFDRGPVELCANGGPSEETIKTLVACDKFVLRKLTNGNHELAATDSFKIITVPAGKADVECAGESLNLDVGQTVLLPAAAPGAVVNVNANATVLVAELPG